VPLTEVRVNASWQRPLLINAEKVKSFANLMETGREFDPIQVIVTKDGCYEVRDGHHRFMASQQCSFTQIPVESSKCLQCLSNRSWSRFELTLRLSPNWFTELSPVRRVYYG
jgi:hypothetical protein